MKLIDVIDSWISGDWGSENANDKNFNSVFCIRSADIVPIYNNSFEKATVRYVSTKSLKNNKLSVGDIVIEKSGGTKKCSTGRPIYITEEIFRNNNPLVCSNFCTAFKVKNDFDSYFVYYFLRNIHNRGIFMNFEGKTSGIHNLDVNAAYQAIVFPNIDLLSQCKIAAVLSSLDNKIALNRRINAKLEQIAKRLYDYWFVQFDFPNAEGKPYKSSGGKMVYNSVLKREIPEGWEVDNLYRITDFVNGLACQKFRPKDDEDSLPMIKIQEMHNGITSNTERVSANIPNKHLIVDGDILFSWSATLEVMIWKNGVGGLNQHIFKVIPKNGLTKEYVFQQLSSYVINFVKMAESRKTTMGHITSDHLNQSRVVIPPADLIEKYSSLCSSLYKEQIIVSKQIIKLTALRDKLLPLLMNGQVTVK